MAMVTGIRMSTWRGTICRRRGPTSARATAAARVLVATATTAPRTKTQLPLRRSGPSTTRLLNGGGPDDPPSIPVCCVFSRLFSGTIWSSPNSSRPIPWLCITVLSTTCSGVKTRGTWWSALPVRTSSVAPQSGPGMIKLAINCFKVHYQGRGTILGVKVCKGCQVKPGSTVSCEPGAGSFIHLSQAALGETKKGSENVVLFVKVGDRKLAIGTLSADKHPQIMWDLFFGEAFELSHNSKTTSVFFCGYKVVKPDMFKADSGEEEDEQLETDETPVKNNETAAAKIPAKDDTKDKQDDDSSDDTETSSGADESDDFEDDSSNEDGMSSGLDDSSGDDSKDEETPMQPEVDKKRTAATALKTPASDKKANMSTPKKDTGDKKSVHVDTPHPAKKGSKTPADSFISGDQKSVHVDTPHPAKKASKTPADGRWKEKAPKTPAENKAKEKSPKSGSHSCKSYSKTFNSAVALESHQKAKKHEA